MVSDRHACNASFLNPDGFVANGKLGAVTVVCGGVLRFQLGVFWFGVRRVLKNNGASFFSGALLFFIFMVDTFYRHGCGGFQARFLQNARLQLHGSLVVLPN